MQRHFWGRDQIRAAEQNEEAYRTSRETRSKSWRRIDKITTLLPAALSGLFLLLVLFWIVIFVTS